MTTATELRALCRELHDAVMKSPCLSVALPAVHNCIDHLTAIARVHELNEQVKDED